MEEEQNEELSNDEIFNSPPHALSITPSQSTCKRFHFLETKEKQISVDPQSLIKPPLIRKQRSLRRNKSCGDGRSSSPPEDFDQSPKQDDGRSFKCSALCLFLPKRKPKLMAAAAGEEEERSKGASMERFECVSWIDGEDQSGQLSYFDLPLELLRCSDSEGFSRVKAAFVFEGDLKGALKKGSAAGGSNKFSSRHVRFSTSTPTSYPASPACVTPRLMRARDEFNALLEATTNA